jgi:hypothetical protein
LLQAKRLAFSNDVGWSLRRTTFMGWRIKSAMTMLLLSCSFFAHAQNTEPDLKRELTLDKEYTPTLEDANKINSLPEIKAPEVTRTPVTFSNYTLDYNQPFHPSNFGIVNYFPDFATSNKHGYLHLGVANNRNIDGDLGYQLLHSSTNQLSIFASHRSSDSKVTYLYPVYAQLPGSEKMKINDNLLATNYVHQFKQFKLFADAQYISSVFNYYGANYFPYLSSGYYGGYGSAYGYDNYTPAYSTNKDPKNQLFRAHAGVASDKNKEIDYKANINYTLYKYAHGNEVEGNRTENRLITDLDIHSYFFGVAGTIKNYHYQVASYSDEADFVKLFGNYNYTTLVANPYLTFEGGNWDARLGASLNAQMGGIKKMILAPNVQFNWRPTDLFLLYLSADGGIQDNSNYNIYFENRYLDPMYRVNDSKSPFDGTIGINFTPVSHLNIDLFAGYKWVEDEHFYKNDYLSLIPDYADATVFKLGGAIKYTYQDILDVDLKVVYNHWNITKSGWIQNAAGDKLYTDAWNKPKFMGDFNIGYKIPEFPLRVDLSYHLETGRKSMDANYFNSGYIKNIHALNLQGTYEINDAFSIFAKANNLLFQKYDLWYGYPAQNFNVMAGINWKF